MTNFGIEMMLFAFYFCILIGLFGVLIAVIRTFYELRKATYKMNKEAEKNGEEL